MKQLIHQFIDQLKQQKYSANSLSNHQRDLKRFEKWLGGSDTKEITLFDLQVLKKTNIEEYLTEMSETMKPRTIARHISTLKLFFDFLESQGHIEHAPTYLIEFPDYQMELPELLSFQEVEALLESPPQSHYLGLRDRSMLELAYSSGLKVNELLNLNVEDLFLDLEFVKIRGKRHRMVPITRKAIEMLHEYLAQARENRLLNKEDPCLFPGRNGTRMSRMGYWAMITKHARRIGITRPINARVIRHSFAAHLIQNGMDLDHVMTLMGYVDMDAMLRYAHINRPDYFEVYLKAHPRGRSRNDQNDPESVE
ncbi:MAG: tyrosine-type recombinase/integrase [SAR324 cluster bacterium]|nr:tyrosine-type recombinase/integrase [SAR324 cluster bacterium]